MPADSSAAGSPAGVEAASRLAGERDMPAEAAFRLAQAGSLKEVAWAVCYLAASAVETVVLHMPMASVAVAAFAAVAVSAVLPARVSLAVLQAQKTVIQTASPAQKVPAQTASAVPAVQAAREARAVLSLDLGYLDFPCISIPFENTN